MGPREQVQLSVMFSHLGEYYQRPLDDHVIRMYVADLQDLELSAVVQAIHVLRREPGRRTCPLPADIRSRAGVRGETAEELAARIVAAVPAIGRNRPQMARERVGEVGWAVVQRMGGWAHLCGYLTLDNTNTFRAQCREICRSAMDRAAVQAAPTRSVLPDHVPPRRALPSPGRRA